MCVCVLGGGEGSLNISCFFFFICFVSLKPSPEGYIIYRIVKCVSLIRKLCNSGIMGTLVNNSSCWLVFNDLQPFLCVIIFISQKYSYLLKNMHNTKTQHKKHTKLEQQIL